MQTSETVLACIIKLKAILITHLPVFSSKSCFKLSKVIKHSIRIYGALGACNILYMGDMNIIIWHNLKHETHFRLQTRVRHVAPEQRKNSVHVAILQRRSFFIFQSLVPKVVLNIPITYCIAKLHSFVAELTICCHLINAIKLCKNISVHLLILTNRKNNTLGIVAARFSLEIKNISNLYMSSHSLP